MVLWENEYFLTSNLLCFFTSIYFVSIISKKAKPRKIAVFGLGVFGMARRHALVSLRHAAPSQHHAAPYFFN